MTPDRALGVFESAQVLTNDHFPFNVVTVLAMSPGPEPGVLRQALATLCDRHPLLRARVSRVGGRFRFRIERNPELPLELVRHPAAEGWQQVAERELNTGFDTAAGPLFRVTCLLASDGTVADLILTTQHVIFDAVSGTHLLDELLTRCQRLAAGLGPGCTQTLPLNPAAETRFPAPYRGWRGRLRTARFAARQIAEEAVLRWRNRGRREPPIAAAGRCRIHTFELSQAATAALARRCRRERVTVNSALCAAQLIVAAQDLPGQAVLRHFVFADLRPYLAPTLAPEHLGSYFAMLSLTTPVDDRSDLWPLARVLSAQLHAASRRGDKFTSVRLSRVLMRTILNRRRIRMGHAALAYGGGARLDERYGDVRVAALHAFVSNFVLGPPYTANGRRFLGRIWWDTVYLDSDMDATAAAAVGKRVLGLLTRAGQI